MPSKRVGAIAGSGGHSANGSIISLVGSTGGAGGNGSNVGKNSTSDLSVNNGSAIVAFSNGGRSGKGGDGSVLTDSIKSGAIGNGGNTGQVYITNGGQISFGIFAQAAGGNGGKTGDANGDVAKAKAALRGHDAMVTITNNEIIETHGAQSNGLVGKSVGGKGGNGNNVTLGGSVDTTTADGGHGGNGESVNIGNEGSIAINNGHAIYAESIGWCRWNQWFFGYRSQ